MSGQHGIRIIAAFFVLAVAAVLVGWLFVPEPVPPVSETDRTSPVPALRPGLETVSDTPASAPEVASPAPAAPRGPKVGEIVAPARRDVTPSTLTQTAKTTGPLVRVEGVAPRPSTNRPRKREETLHRVVVVDGGHLRSGRQMFSLARISALALDETCTSPEGETWPCGMAARTALRRLIRGRAVTCRRADSPDGKAGAASEPGGGSEAAYLCDVGGQDLGEWMLRQGWAAPAQESDAESVKLVFMAKDAGRGQWRQTGLPTVADDTDTAVSSADDTFDDLVERLELAPEVLQPDLAVPGATDNAQADDFFGNGAPASDGASTPLQPALR